MTTLYFDLDDFSVTPAAEVKAQSKACIAELIREGVQKRYQVHKYIRANNQTSNHRALIEKFDLDWGLGKEYGNGLCEVIVYADISQRVEIIRFHDKTSNWFRA